MRNSKIHIEFLLFEFSVKKNSMNSLLLNTGHLYAHIQTNSNTLKKIAYKITVFFHNIH